MTIHIFIRFLALYNSVSVVLPYVDLFIPLAYCTPLDIAALIRASADHLARICPGPRGLEVMAKAPRYAARARLANRARGP